MCKRCERVMGFQMGRPPPGRGADRPGLPTASTIIMMIKDATVQCIMPVSLTRD